MPFTPASKFSDVENRVRDNPEYFVATAFRGRSQFDRRRAETFEEVCAAAEKLYEDRPVMIYAISGGFQAMIGLWRR